MYTLLTFCKTNRQMTEYFASDAATSTQGIQPNTSKSGPRSTYRSPANLKIQRGIEPFEETPNNVYNNPPANRLKRYICLSQRSKLSSEHLKAMDVNWPATCAETDQPITNLYYRATSACTPHSPPIKYNKARTKSTPTNSTLLLPPIRALHAMSRNASVG